MVMRARAAAVGTGDERERIIREFMPYIRYTARRFAWRLPPALSEDDLVSVGVIGLLDAMRKFRAGEVKLKTYAEYRIKGAMLDEVRAADTLPRTVRERVNALKCAEARLEQRLGRVPDDGEVAEALGVSIDEYHKVLLDSASGLTLHFGDFDARGDGQGERDFLESVPDPAAKDPLALLESVSRRDALAGVVDELPEKEKLVLSLYYRDELTMKEIGKVLGLTEGRVCQLHGQAIVRCKARLQRESRRRAPERAAALAAREPRDARDVPPGEVPRRGSPKPSVGRHPAKMEPGGSRPAESRERGVEPRVFRPVETRVGVP